ncbi:hypothetical protein JW905_14095 [bacterium]|nr:hypothetical protein [candidate division CSSED10-310 bacterium]
MSRQRSLPLDYRERYNFASFVTCGQNLVAFETVRDMAFRRPGGVVFIHGPAGVGKSHLLHAFRDELEVRGGQAPFMDWRESDGLDRTFPASGLNTLNEFRFQVEVAACAVMDNMDQLPAVPELHHALVSILNRLAMDGGCVLAAGRLHPAEIATIDDHVRSRLLSGITMSISHPDAEMREELLRKLAGDRGILLPDLAVSYVLTRCPRDIGSLVRIVRAIDRKSMEEGRNISAPLVRSVVDAMFLA